MAIAPKANLSRLMVDKAKLRKMLDEHDRVTGFVPDRTVTVERLHEMLIADGVRPEDNIGSREILRMREEE